MAIFIVLMLEFVFGCFLELLVETNREFLQFSAQLFVLIVQTCRIVNNLLGRGEYFGRLRLGNALFSHEGNTALLFLDRLLFLTRQIAI
jgi:hypothetical protein